MMLTLKYRPRRFWDVAGQRPVAAVLYQMVKRGTVPGALLFSGSRGCGKTSTARILGAALNCAEPPGPAQSWPCGVCPSCLAVATGTSLDVMEVDAASNGGVDQIRSIREIVNYGTGGEYRVVLLDEAQSMSRDAFNSLLKIFEEPPPRTVFVLLTTEPGKILSTVSDRCSPYPFRQIPVGLIRERLSGICAVEGLDTEPELLTAIADQAGGSLRDAIMRLDQVSSVGITSLDMWQELTGETDFAPDLLAMAADGYHEGLFKLLDDVVASTGDYAWVTGQVIRCLRDLLVLSEGGSVAVQGHALTARQDLAARLGPSRIVAAMRVLWDLQVKVRTEDRAAGLSLAAVMVSEKLCPQPAADYPDSSGRQQGAPLDQLRAVLGGA